MCWRPNRHAHARTACRSVTRHAGRRSRIASESCTTHPLGDAARHDVREHHRGRREPTVRGVPHARQSRWLRRGDTEAMGRLISLALRSGIPIMEVHKQLRGSSSDRAVGLGPNKVLSVPDAIGIALEQWWRDKQGGQQELGVTPSAGSGAREPVVVRSSGVAGGRQTEI
jgi:hypothetical protein